jgi:ribosomal protein S20
MAGMQKLTPDFARFGNPLHPTKVQEADQATLSREKKKADIQSAHNSAYKSHSRNVDLQFHSEQEEYDQAAAKTHILAAASLITSIC